MGWGLAFVAGLSTTSLHLPCQGQEAGRKRFTPSPSLQATHLDWYHIKSARLKSARSKKSQSVSISILLPEILELQALFSAPRSRKNVWRNVCLASGPTGLLFDTGQLSHITPVIHYYTITASFLGQEVGYHTYLRSQKQAKLQCDTTGFTRPIPIKGTGCQEVIRVRIWLSQRCTEGKKPRSSCCKCLPLDSLEHRQRSSLL